MIKAEWDVPSNIHCLTTTHLFSNNKNHFNQFNLANHIEDQKHNVLQNRLLLSKKLKLPSSPLWLNQTHGSQCINASDYSNEPNIQMTDNNSADAIITNQKLITLAILTADCLPIALYHPPTSTIALIHAGWRGLLNELIHNTVSQFPKPHNQIIGWLGPCIQQQNYEVNQDWLNQQPKQLMPFIMESIKIIQQKPYLCLQTLATKRLNQYGIHSINQCPMCTYQNSNLFFSYRRDGKTTGRMATLLWITEKPE